MLSRLQQVASDVRDLNCKLVLLVGRPGSGKTALLEEFAERAGAHLLNVGSRLGRQLAVLPQKQRSLEASNILRDLADESTHDGLLLIDNIELLFDRSLHLNPLDTLKRQASEQRVVAVWPGQMHDGRLIYAELGHPEHREFGVDGLVTLEVT